MPQPDWLALLAPLRARGQGSLRFLERAMHERGASPHAVRNLIYRGVGSQADRRVLHEILRELYAQAGLSEPGMPEPEPAPSELSLLGREKRRAYRQFYAGVRSGRTPRLVVTGRAGTGKTLLIEHLERDLARLPEPPGVTRLLLGSEAAPALLELGAESLRRLHPGLPFGVQAALQQQAAREVHATLRDVLLLRVVQGTLQGTSPRAPDGTAISLGSWALRSLFQELPAGVAVLLALEDPADIPPDFGGEVIHLRPPGAEEARRFLLGRASLAPREVEEVMRAAGRNLDRLALLAAVRGLHGASDEATVARVLRDPDVRELLSALQAALLEGDTSVSREVLEAALGRPIAGLPPHARALLEETNPGEPRPVSRALLPAVREHLSEDELRAAHLRAARAYQQGAGGAGHELRRLHHLTEARAWDEVAAVLEEPHVRTELSATVWARARGDVQGHIRLRLARATVRHYVLLGRYDHPDAKDALDALLSAPDPTLKAWAQVKLAESSVDRGAFDEAQALLQTPELQRELAQGAAGELRADVALVRAALARWRGDVGAAVQASEEALANAPAAHLGRARLWRGLIAKDRGDWGAALRDLSEVPTVDPLLRARARYQEGDLRLRLGQPVAAQLALVEALAALKREGAPLEEQARVQARLGTALRRLGRVREAWAHLAEASSLLPDFDPVVAARVLSETVPVHLALAQPDAGLRAASAALAWLEHPTKRNAEAEYRARRARYRLALAYLTRGLARPYLPPLPGATADNADLRAARALLDATLDAPDVRSDREHTLRLDAYLSRALAQPDPALAEHDVSRALELVDHPYSEVQVRSARAEVHLRAGRHEPALSEINRAHVLLRRVSNGGDPDPGLWASLLALEARATLREGEPLEQLRFLRETLADPLLTPFRDGVLREAGEALESLGEATARRVLRELNAPAHLGGLRPADALRQLPLEAGPTAG